MDRETLPNRQSIRLKGYDYSAPGAYFVTICTAGQICLFGAISEGKMVVNPAGKIVESIWQQLARQFPFTQIGDWVIMPNHFHAIIKIEEKTLAIQPNTSAPKGQYPGPQSGSIGAMIGQFKSRSTRKIWKLPGQAKTPFWHRNYYEHIIRNDAEWARIVDYIHANPARWAEDKFHIG